MRPHFHLTTPFAVFRMHFGLKNAPALFQRTMYDIPARSKWKLVLNYLDDFVIIPKTPEKHIDLVKQMLKIL